MASELPRMKILTSRWAQNERKIVRERHGSVLFRGLILKRDQAASGEDYALEHAVGLEGAPLFARQTWAWVCMVWHNPR